MTVNSKSERKLVILAQALRWDDEAAPRGSSNQRGDMRLVATAMRYKVQKFDYRSGFKKSRSGWMEGTSWVDVQRMKRTTHEWIDQEYECATRMFERRVREAKGVIEMKLWPSVDGRVTPLAWLTDGHLVNIYNKINRGGWRPYWMAPIGDELRRRGLPTFPRTEEEAA